MQLASNMAVGLAMFLSAILFPVFLVACNAKSGSQNTPDGKCHRDALLFLHVENVHILCGCLRLRDYDTRKALITHCTF